MLAPGLRQGLLSFALEFTPLVGPLHPACHPWGGEAPSETGDSLTQLWLWATRLRCSPCVCSGLRVSMEESSSQERNSGITVACKELHPFLVNPQENVEVGNHDHCHGVY